MHGLRQLALYDGLFECPLSAVARMLLLLAGRDEPDCPEESRPR